MGVYGLVQACIWIHFTLVIYTHYKRSDLSKREGGLAPNDLAVVSSLGVPGTALQMGGVIH